jgi:hypothetical protein
MPVELRLPLSPSGLNLNLWQETGGPRTRCIASIVSMKRRTVLVDPQQRQDRTRVVRFILMALLLVRWITAPVHLEAAVVLAQPRITVIVYPERQMPDAEWVALLQDLQQGFTNLALETHFTPVPVDIIRGDTLQHHVAVDAAVAIYLHGECTLLAQPDQSVRKGALGWVLREHGRIAPFIHVDCARIGNMLGPSALWMKGDRRTLAMAEAIARVVLHEWIHIARQSATHESSGLSKGGFSVADLIPDYYPFMIAAGHGR